MDRYVVISDPIRSKEFAIVGDVGGSIKFHPLNEMAKEWAKESMSIKSLHSISVPDGMHISSPKRMTTSISLIFEDNQREENNVNISNIKTVNVFHGREINSKNKKTNIKNIQLRKVSGINKTNLVDFKAQYFINRAKKSSAISAIRFGAGKLNAKSASFVSKADRSIDVLLNTAGYGLLRRLAVSEFIMTSKNRLSRRSKSLSVMSEEKSRDLNNGESIDAAISAKVKRFT